MSREVHVRFWERVGVKFPRATRLPLYRQSQIFERDGIDLDRSTLADWIGKSATLLEPLAKAIERHVLKGAAIFADDTPVNMLSPARPRSRGSGPMFGMNGHGRVKRHRRHSIASRVTARASSRPNISRTIPAGCTRTDTRGSTSSISRAVSARSRAWHISGASSSMCSSRRAQ